VDELIKGIFFIWIFLDKGVFESIAVKIGILCPAKWVILEARCNCSMYV